MGDFYELVSAASISMRHLHSEIEQLHSNWTHRGLVSGDLVYLLFETANYVGNAFRKTVEEHQGEIPESGSHSKKRPALDPYNPEVPQAYENMWKDSIGRQLNLYHDRHPVYVAAHKIVDDVMPSFGEAIREDPDRSYGALTALVREFAEKMQNSRSLL
jgi:hypothetical protein